MNTERLEQPERVELDNLRIDNITSTFCVDIIVSRAGDGQGGWLVTPNSDISRQAYHDPAVLQLINQADLIVADGMPLLWASRLQGTPIKERICGSDLVWTVAQACAKHDLSLFLLGGGLPDTAARAANTLALRYPSIRIAGTHYPPFGFETRPEQIQEIEAQLRKAMPNVVYVALGFPRAEQLIARLKPKFPHVWWLGVGISLSFICGEVKRAPRWMQSLGLEWLHRLLQEPGRLTKRYLWHDIPYVLGLLGRSIISRLRGHRGNYRF